MSHPIVWAWRRKPEPPTRASHDTRGYAPHLRGRVHKTGRTWWIEVVNTHTGKRVIYDDGHGDLDHAFTDAEFATAVARAAWMRDLRQRSLK